MFASKLSKIAKTMEAAAKPVLIYEVKMRETVALPTLSPKPKKKVTTISYSMPPKRVKVLANGFGDINMSNRDVGISSFEYAYADLAEDD